MYTGAHEVQTGMADSPGAELQVILSHPTQLLGT